MVNLFFFDEEEVEEEGGGLDIGQPSPTFFSVYKELKALLHVERNIQVNRVGAIWWVAVEVISRSAARLTHFGC